jgi:hypothetical protein
MRCGRKVNLWMVTGASPPPGATVLMHALLQSVGENLLTSYDTIRCSNKVLAQLQELYRSLENFKNPKIRGGQS